MSGVSGLKPQKRIRGPTVGHIPGNYCQTSSRDLRIGRVLPSLALAELAHQLLKK
ncbi:hypothetical protein M2171_006394 [Bradyrhizobium japonicum USDA 38]|nr:hypothetical protein [Bradyrhizobium japonicum USDA 38]MCS3949776.1 hypothetical protein [Bradyrhizobium japonicum]MCW2217541.1 hypothetical protein [Bradyrhizobium japonicum]MCW2342155.1 hypothetical protein [Bradyrhizobium japonicum]